MSSILKAELQIVGSDKTGAAFAGVLKHAEELRSALGRFANMPLGTDTFKKGTAEIKQQTAALNSELRAVQAINRAISAGNAGLAERSGLMQRMRQRLGGMSEGLGLYGWMGAGYAAGRTMRAAAHDTAEFEHQHAMLATTTGMTRGEVEEAVRAAERINVPLMSATDNLKALGELRMVFGSTEHAIANVEAVQRAAAVLKAINPERNAEAEAYDLARALELRGVSMDPQHFNRLNNQMVQAINASRGKITGEDFFEFTKYAGSATTRTLSDYFYTRIAPSLMQEMKSNTAGRALATMRRQMVGGHMQVSAATEWMKLGLLDPHKVDFDKIGHVKKVHPGALTDSDLFVQDPYAWLHRYLEPALKQRGITKDEQVAVEMANLFSDRYAENMATILMTQKQRLEKDAGLTEQAAGTEAIDEIRKHDPKSALTDLAAGVNSLLAAFGSPLAGTAITVMNRLADAARAIARGYGSLSGDSPMTAAALSAASVVGLGAVGLKGMQATLGFLTGATALKGSAVALTQSAAALDAAAARLGVGGTVGPWGSTAAGVAGTGAGLTFGTAVGLLALLGIGAAGEIDIRSRYPEYFETDNPYPTPPPDFDELKSHDKLSIEEFVRKYGLAPEGRHGGIGSDAVNSEGEIKATLEGEAQLHSVIEVKPSSEFWTSIKSMIENGIRGITINGASTGTTGSTGSAMPEAAPTGAHK